MFHVPRAPIPAYGAKNTSSPDPPVAPTLEATFGFNNHSGVLAAPYVCWTILGEHEPFIPTSEGHRTVWPGAPAVRGIQRAPQLLR